MKIADSEAYDFDAAKALKSLKDAGLDQALEDWTRLWRTGPTRNSKENRCCFTRENSTFPTIYILDAKLLLDTTMRHLLGILANLARILPSQKITGGQASRPLSRTTLKAAPHVNSLKSTDHWRNPPLSPFLQLKVNDPLHSSVWISSRHFPK